MAGFIPPEKIDQIRAANDIVEVIQSYIPLKKSGSGFVALCPFHQEKTPSFHVSPSKQLFYCFGCHKGGDVFRFLQEYEKLTFPEAVRRLAERAGISLEWSPDWDQAAQSQRTRERLRQLLEHVTQYWHRLLLQDPGAEHARRYLEERGLTKEAIRRFRLGYAPAGWTTTLEWAQQKGYRVEELEQAGLAIVREESRGPYDRFRDRLIFPICDEQGRVVGFSGRVLSQEAEAAKYINTPETVLFQKGRLLFGLDKARRALMQTGTAVICEGQIDLIRCHLNGIENVVAPLGTALTRDHCRILQRYVKEVVLCFDADPAGQRAALRTLDELLESGLAIRVAVLPEPHDPDSFIRSFGPEAFQIRVEEAQGFFDFLIDWWCHQEDITTDRGRTAVVQGVGSAVLKSRDPTLMDAVLRKLSLRLGLSLDAVRLAWKRLRREQAQGAQRMISYLQTQTSDATGGASSVEKPPSSHELWLLRVLVADPELLPWAMEHISVEWIEHSAVRVIVERLYQKLSEEGNVSLPTLYRELEDDYSRQLLSEAAIAQEPILEPGQVLADVARILELRYLDKQIHELKRQLATQAQAQKPEVNEAELIQELNRLLLRRAELKSSTPQIQ